MGQDSDLSDDVHLVTVKFAWADDDPDIEIKPMSTMLCGSTGWRIYHIHMCVWTSLWVLKCIAGVQVKVELTSS